MPTIGKSRPETAINEFKKTFENLSEEKRRKLLEIKTIRDNIGSFISKREQIDQLIKIIDESTVFSIKSERNRKIDTRLPWFIMTWNWEEMESKYKFSNRRNEYEKLKEKDFLPVAKKYIMDENKVAEIAREEIFIPFSNWLADFLVDQDKFKLFFEEKFNMTLDNEDEEFIRNLSMLFVNIFQSRILLNSAVYHMLPQL